jgi:hypothetical protein
MAGPSAVSVDAPGKLSVADTNDNHVLEYDWALFQLMLPLVRR